MPQRVSAGLETVRRLALALPGVEEGSSYGTPGFRVRGRFLALTWEDGVHSMTSPETAMVQYDPARVAVRGRSPTGMFALRTGVSPGGDRDASPRGKTAFVKPTVAHAEGTSEP